jgi:hypothetical protein
LEGDCPYNHNGAAPSQKVLGGDTFTSIIILFSICKLMLVLGFGFVAVVLF